MNNKERTDIFKIKTEDVLLRREICKVSLTAVKLGLIKNYLYE